MFKIARSLVAVSALAVAAVAHAAYPERPITLVVPYAAGGAADALARVIAPLEVLKEEEVQRRFSDLGAQPVGSAPAGFAAFLKKEDAKWGEVVRKGGIKLD